MPAVPPFSMSLTKYAAWSIIMASYAHELPYTIPLAYLSLFAAVVAYGTEYAQNDLWVKV